MSEQVETVHDALDEYIARYSNWGHGRASSGAEAWWA